MKTYTIDTRNGQSRKASSMSDAIAIARSLLGASRLYRGAEYQTDRDGKDGDRESATGLDMWQSRKAATQESNGMADAVIAW